ncbi:hypothetical protein SAMN04489737_0417 [Arcanobacterium phocae]|uniref:DUF6571 domain-containing protein n=1 Tax=Arcanobacterium phocae TaxID=131112 RepID=A0A1H2LBT0_9ACTO|nr:DUF6571 family protein [Arcanobacterium phocae]SDU78302.1 hypothetical protein SAMN04489737_0417 [Arcanobacterium phocae]
MLSRCLRIRFFAVLLAASVFLSGCGASPASSSDTSSSSDVVFGCGDIDGVDTMVSDALSDTGSTLEELSVQTSRFATDPAYADSICGYVVDKLNALSVSSGVDEIDRVSALLDGLASSPQASARFITALGGDKLVDRMNLTQQFYHVPSYPVVDHPQSRYAIVLKKVFITAQPYLSPGQSVGLARQMAQHLSTTHTTAISWLLYDATLTSEFLTEFGDQLERYEHTHTTTTTAGAGGVDWLWVKPTSTRFKVLFPARVRDAWYDPATSFMSALAHNPQAALTFFTPTTSENATGGRATGNDGENETNTNTTDNKSVRQNYWFHDRSWGLDGYTAISAALDAAVTTQGQAGSLQAATLTTHAMKNFATIKPVFSPQAVEHVIHILATYMPAIDHCRATTPPNTWSRSTIDPYDLLDLPAMPSFTRNDIQTLISLTTHTDEGIHALHAAVDNYHGLLFTTVFNTHQTTHNTVGDMSSVVDVIGQVNQADIALEGFIFHAILDARLAGDPYQAPTTWLTATTATPVVPVFEHPTDLIDYLATQPLTTNTTTLAETTSERREDVQGLSGGVFNRRESVIIHALFVSGVVDQDEFMDYTRQHEEEPGQVDRWFSGGSFPTSDMIYNNGLLRDELEDFLKTENYDMDDLFDTFADEAPEIR